jgi:hypothetical protein
MSITFKLGIVARSRNQFQLLQRNLFKLFCSGIRDDHKILYRGHEIYIQYNHFYDLLFPNIPNNIITVQ